MDGEHTWDSLKSLHRVRSSVLLRGLLEETRLHYARKIGKTKSLNPVHPLGHGSISVHDPDGFPSAFHTLYAAVLHIRMTLPPEKTSPRHPTAPPPGG